MHRAYGVDMYFASNYTFYSYCSHSKGSHMDRRRFLQAAALPFAMTSVSAIAALEQTIEPGDTVSRPAQRIVEANDIRIHIAEQGTGPLVVLCHGFPESWYSW